MEEYGGRVADVRRAFVEEVEREYERQGAWLVKGEGVNWSIARK